MVDEKKPRGFGLLSPERRKEISSAGGRAAHAAGTAYQFTTETAKVAGSKGGMEIARRRREGTIGTGSKS